MINVNFLKLVKCEGQKVKYQQRDLTCNTRNIVVKYPISRTQMLLIRLKYSKSPPDSKVKVIN